MQKKLPALREVCSPPGRKAPALAVLAALGALAATPVPAGAASGQDARVMVDALVLDRAGNPVPGLDVSDFEVIIGDRVGPVTATRTVAADRETRRFVFVLNRRGATAAQLRRMKDGLEEFVAERFGNRDEALFVDFAEVPRMTRGWRTGRAEALPEVQNITAMGFRSALGPAEDAADTAFMLQALARHLAEVPGRKVVVLFSGSLSTFAGEPGGNLGHNRFPYDPPNWLPNLPSSKEEAGDALGYIALAFNSANASIYAIHLEGTRRQEDGILVASRGEIGETRHFGGSRGTTGTPVRNSSASLSGRRRDASPRLADDFLSALAPETGGSYTAHATDFARILNGIEASNRLWYELSFESFGSNIPGRYQPHEVRVRNRRGLQVIVRPGHVVPN